ncbi:MAG TPA: hypothetical protein VLA23_12420 [Candidatus Limnocylindrales bacterium]|nr:hypothetical protein [Candidatus Limnocylindrales bacterium]
MGRKLAVVFVVGVVLLFASVLVERAAPSSGLFIPLVVTAVVMLTVVVWAIFVSAWQTKGWSLRHPGREDE